MEYINGKDLYNMFNYGTYYIMQEREYLNDINVFPVADGDTGNNLLQTLKTISLESIATESFKDSLESISNSALIGSRGNSGIIFAQFVNGLQKANGYSEKVSFTEFSRLVEESIVHTYSSLSNPVEGTMITIMKEWSIILKKLIKEEGTLLDKFTESFTHIYALLENTKKMLDVLRDNDVVDSGALGFVLFVKGIVSYYNNDDIDVIAYENIEIVDHHKFEGEITHRFCTEGLVKAKKIDESMLRKQLEIHGDSLVIAEGKSRFRVHIHTNNPQNVFESLKKFGEIESQKVDDMKLDMSLKNSSKKRVLVTDSIADINQELLDDNNVVVIPINISVDNIPYLDKLSITNEMLFKNLDQYKEYPNTSTPSIKYINDLFSRLLLQFDEILIVTVSAHLSATYNVILGEASKLTEKGKKIYVVDSYNNSATEGLLVEAAINMMNQDVTTTDIVKELEIQREKTEILVCLETFKYATMSGRLPKVIGKIGMFFGIRPIMSLKNGKGAAFGMALSQKSITKKIKKFIKKDLDKTGIKAYSLVHCLNEGLALQYKKEFTELIGKAPSYITEISSATAIHSGVGSVAIGYIKK